MNKVYCTKVYSDKTSPHGLREEELSFPFDIQNKKRYLEKQSIIWDFVEEARLDIEDPDVKLHWFILCANTEQEIFSLFDTLKKIYSHNKKSEITFSLKSVRDVYLKNKNENNKG